MATPAPRPKTKNIRLVRLLLAAFLVFMVVAQLFTFEKFPEVIGAMWFSVGGDWWPVLAAVIVVLEVAALPYLLALYLSVGMRVLSMVAGWLVIMIWLVLSIGNIFYSDTVNSGLLGETIPLPIGWWAPVFCLALGVLAAWTAWGIWPLTRRKKVA